MGDPEKVNAQVVDSIKVASQATTTPEVVRVEGAGKAYQSVAQSMAIAVQDATDNLRNIGMISTTAQGVAMAKLLETEDTFYAQVIEQAQKMSSVAATTFRTIGTDAADVLKGFPSD